MCFKSYSGSVPEKETGGAKFQTKFFEDENVCDMWDF